MPFMAIKMLMKASVKTSVNPSDTFFHSAKHDLESLFYVLLYISTLYSGPQQKMGAAELQQAHSSLPILEWVKPEAFQKSFHYCKGDCGAELNRFLAGGPKLIYYNRWVYKRQLT